MEKATLRGYRPPALEAIQPRSKLDTGTLPGGRSSPYVTNSGGGTRTPDTRIMIPLL